jgi:hypothetical protein
MRELTYHHLVESLLVEEYLLGQFCNHIRPLKLCSADFPLALVNVATYQR